MLGGILIDCGTFAFGCQLFELSALQSGGSTVMDPQISPWGGYCVGFGAIWARLLG